MEKSPFDGTVVDAIVKDGDQTLNLAWEAFRPKTMKRESFAGAVKVTVGG